MILIASRWFNNMTIPYGCIGVVLTMNEEKEYQVHIGIAPGNDLHEDARKITGWGNKIDPYSGGCLISNGATVHDHNEWKTFRQQYDV